MIFKILLPIMALLVCSCANTGSMNNSRNVAEATNNKSAVFQVAGVGAPVDVYLNTEYRGAFVAGVKGKDCTGSISIWFYLDESTENKGALRYYSKGQKAIGADCELKILKLFSLGDLADKSQSGMDACAGDDFNYKVVDLGRIDYLRRIDFVSKRVVAPVCESEKEVKETSDKLELYKFKSNGGSGALHLQIVLNLLGEKKMNYYIAPMISLD